MDLLSPLSRLLGFSRATSNEPSVQRLEQSLSARDNRFAKANVTNLGANQNIKQSGNISPSILTSTTRASAGEQKLLAQLRSLSPQGLRSFVSQRLPFLDDPRFVLALARVIGEAQRASRNHSARAATATGSEDEKLPEDAKLKTSSEPISRPGKLAESYQLRDRSGIIWRAWFLPIALEGRLERIGIYHTQRQNRGTSKGSDRDGKKRDNRDSSRLVFAIDFTHTGALEIEAEYSEGKLRVALRSLNGFSLEARAGIQARFSEILQDLDLQGQIVFHKVDSLPLSSLNAAEESRVAASDESEEVLREGMIKVAKLDDKQSTSNATNWEIKL